MDRRDVIETLLLLALTCGMLAIGIRLARAFAAVLAWAFVAVQ